MNKKANKLVFPSYSLTIVMMIQISSFGSRAQIAQLIEEITNQITNKSKQSSKKYLMLLFS